MDVSPVVYFEFVFVGKGKTEPEAQEGVIYPVNGLLRAGLFGCRVFFPVFFLQEDFLLKACPKPCPLSPVFFE